MLKADQVPDEAEKGIRRAMHKGGTAKEYIAAAINAWPGMWKAANSDGQEIFILPLPAKEGGDE